MPKLYGDTSNWQTIGCRIPPADYKRLMEKHPDRGKVSKVLRALVQMYLDNKINKLEFTVKEIIGS
jgi:hypothetical protein